MLTRPFRTVLAVVAAVLLVAGCSSSGDDSADESDDSNEKSDEPTTETIEIELASGSTLVADVPTEPVATAPATDDGTDLEVYQLERSGDAVTLVFAIHNTTDGEVDVFEFSTAALSEFAADGSVGGVTLLDGENLNLHLVFRQDNASNTCVCSEQDTAELEAGERRFFAAVFPAPPDDVEAMTVQTGLGTVSGVPLTEAG